MQTLKTRKAAILIGIFLAYLYFRGIGDHGLIDNVEGINASVAAHMFGSGNFFVPKIGEALTAGSTMGTWWLMSIALKIFGWGEFSVRFFSALAGLGMILISALLARTDSKLKLDSESEELKFEDDSEFEIENKWQSGSDRQSASDISPRRSWLGAAVCAAMTGCFVVSQIASSHAMFSFLTSLALLGVIKSHDDEDWLMFSHISIALAFIAHGPAGLFMPFIAVSFYCVLSGDMELLKNFFTWPFGILINIFLSGLYIILLMAMNPNIILFMFCRGHEYSFGGTLGALIFLFVSFAPFHGFLIQSLFEIFPRRYPTEKSPEFLMLVWAMTFTAYAIFSADVLSITAAIPALSAILAIRLDFWLRGKMLPVRYAVLFNILILVPAFFILLPMTTDYFPVIKNSLMSLVPYEITLALFIFACWYYTKTRQTEKWVRNVLVAALLCLMPVAGVFNLTADLYSIGEIGKKIRENVQGNDIVIQYGANFPSIYFYTFRNSRLIKSPLTPGVQEKKFVEDVSFIADKWPRRERIFLIVPSDRTAEAKIPNKNVIHLLESNGFLLLSNR